MTKTLKDYAKHDEDCDVHRCAFCGGWRPGRVQHDDCRCVGALYPQQKSCSCGLATLLSGEGESRREQDKDHGAGLIHHVASPLAETEPRLNEIEELRAEVARLTEALGAARTRCGT